MAVVGIGDKVLNDSETTPHRRIGIVKGFEADGSVILRYSDGYMDTISPNKLQIVD